MLRRCCIELREGNIVTGGKGVVEVFSIIRGVVNVIANHTKAELVAVVE